MTVKEPGNAAEDVQRIAAHPQAGGQETHSEVEVRRAGRADLAPIAALVREASASQLGMDESDVMEWLFSKGLWVAEINGELAGVAAWQAENLLCVTDVLYVHPPELLDSAAAALMTTIEAEANTLMCEANVVTHAVAGDSIRGCLLAQGYEARRYDELHRIWREVLQDFVACDEDLLVKRLRDRMVMVPI